MWTRENGEYVIREPLLNYTFTIRKAEAQTWLIFCNGKFQNFRSTLKEAKSAVERWISEDLNK